MGKKPLSAVVSGAVPNAEQILANIKYPLERNQVLADDDPENLGISRFSVTRRRG